jgi:hypothetical protein
MIRSSTSGVASLFAERFVGRPDRRLLGKGSSSAPDDMAAEQSLVFRVAEPHCFPLKRNQRHTKIRLRKSWAVAIATPGDTACRFSALSVSDFPILLGLRLFRAGRGARHARWSNSSGR